MKKVISVTILVLIILLSAAEVKKVTSVGFGETPEKALDNALREGLAKVVGMYMSSSTFVKNYQTINDEITSFSNGYIEDYKVVSTKKDDGGLVEVSVEMSVKTGILITKLKELNIATIGVKVDKDFVEKDLKMQNVTKVNQEKLAEEYYKQIVEPIKLNKSHFIKINSFKAYEITDIPKTHYGGLVKIKDINSGEEEEFEHNIYLHADNKYDFMDKYYVLKVNYEYGITDKYYNNCVSFMDAAFKKVEGSIKPEELDGADKIIVSKVTSLMKTGMPDNVYQLDGRTLNKLKKYFQGSRDKQSYKLDFKFKAYDKSGFPMLDFNFVPSRDISEKNNIMAFYGASEPRNIPVPYSKYKNLLNDERFDLAQKETLCKGVLVIDSRNDLVNSTFNNEGNFYILNEDYGINFNVYMVVPKTMVTDIAEIKGELTTE
ncbi:MAG: LPP20 family lipoprotein [Candidatus Delongbacteria bacterium]|nr:LPP20 family lipoprotein [Candidatus Delongbacteria bacterium]